MRPLTPRQAEMVALTWRGLSNRQIAALLFVDRTTVRNTLYTAYRRLGASCRASAAVRLYLVAEGLARHGEHGDPAGRGAAGGELDAA